tara:strand:+ start:74 stop:394 length:321 start_codon:yes stop_codon:yes gene_type:complete
MRQITKDSINAFLNDSEFCKQNMIVEVLSDCTNLKLHNNIIAVKKTKYNHTRFKNTTISITNAGWFSNTTKERLNALPNVHIQQKDFKWYLNGLQWDGNLTDIKLN